MFFKIKFLLCAIFLSSAFNLNSCRSGNCCCGCTGSNPSSREHSYSDYKAENSTHYIEDAHVMDLSFTNAQLKVISAQSDKIKSEKKEREEKEREEKKIRIVNHMQSLDLEEIRELTQKLKNIQEEKEKASNQKNSGSGSASNSSEISPTGTPKGEKN
jgi:hypothetical protein